jgi:hypothetical protein
MRRLKILKVNPTTPSTLGSVEVGSDYTNIFNGRFYRNAAGATQPAYTTPAPADYTLIAATTFDIVENEKYAGRYTVYTPEDVGDLDLESWFTVDKTTVNVNETIPPLDVGDPSTLESDGYVTNISTYLLYTGTAEIVIPPGVNITSFPVEFMGRGTSGWGEGYAQNYINIARNFASGLEPVNAFVGQTWYDTDDQKLRSFNGSSWNLVNETAFGTTFRHTQGTAASTWTVTHLLGLQAPYIAFVQFFVDRGGGPKLIIPADVTFVNANQLTVTFSNPEIGYVLVHQ